MRQKNDSETAQIGQKKKIQRNLIEAVVAYIAFCGLGFLSRLFPLLFLLFVIYGIVFPLAWAKFSGRWFAIGFRKNNFKKALLWGVIAGVVWGVYTYVVFGVDQSLPPLWALQVAIAVPFWFLIMSPFQEFFFRGWLQPKVQSAFGKPAGLIITSLAFTLWHFFPQLEGTPTSTLPISSPIGILSTFLAGLLFGYIYQRTENIITPWVAHALGGVALVLMGMMSFFKYIP